MAKDPALNHVDFEKAGKTLVFIAGGFFVLGVLAVNFYLWNLGISDFSLFKAKYIYTGALAAGPLLLATFCPAYGFYMAKDGFATMAQGRSGNAAVLINRHMFHKSMLVVHFGIAVAGPFCLYFIFLKVKGDAGVWGPLWNSLKMYYMCAATGGLGFLLLLLYFGSKNILENKVQNADSGSPVSKKRARGKISSQMLGFGVALFFLGFFSAYLHTFSNKLYPLIPEQFGGGKPRLAKLVFKADALKGAQEIGFAVSEENRISSEVRVLFENNDIYLVENPKSEIVEINKEMVTRFHHRTFGSHRVGENHPLLTASELGGFPNALPYSRLNWAGLS